MGDWMIPKEAVAEIDRLRAELAEAQLERDTALTDRYDIIQDLRAELATLRLYADEVARDSNRDLANARLERDGVASLNSSLIAELAEAKARIASLEEELASTRFNFTGLRNATTARIAELAEANDHLHNLCAEKHARAERAEAALSFYADERNWHTPPHCYSAAVSDCGTKARAALSPSPAGPDGKSLAVLYCMDRAEEDVKLLREALEGMIAVAEGRFDGNPHADIDALAKARAVALHLDRRPGQ